MQRSYEAYFFINLVMDAALMGVVARANGCFQLRRVLLSACAGAVYALLSVAVSPALAHPAVQLALIVPISLILCGNGETRRWSSVAFQLFCGAATVAGIGSLLTRSLSSTAWKACALAGALLSLHALLCIRARRLSTWEVGVCLAFRGRSIRFRALIDTGNRLREPVSGLPVLIAESSLLKELLSTDNAENAPFRRISFGGLGGGGTVDCFHPDHVWIQRGEQLIPAPEIWVAIYPGKIPGVSRALAPPAFAVIPGKS